jgi:multiple sugar transport system ATP-binding protein
MTAVVLQQLSRRFRDNTAVESLDLEVADKEFVVLLGPSGCGKTTTLNMIAGVDAPTSGRIFFDGHPIEHVPPEKRNVAMVFQSIALYPHKTVYENIAFPLRMARVGRTEIDERVRATARLLRIGELLDRRPHELSGGQRQRVALGRAAVRNPLVFLFDEPLSALDAKLRGEMRLEIKRLHERLDSTLIYVTHDQVEALTMADRIAVMDGGRLRQYGTPDEVYRLPANTTVARFIGSPRMNLIPGRCVETTGDFAFQGSGVAVPFEAGMGVAARASQGMLTLGVRPEGLSTEARGLPLLGMGRVYAVESLGSDQFIDVTYGEDAELVKVRTRPDVRFRVGDAISLNTSPADIYLFDSAGDRIFPNDLRS